MLDYALSREILTLAEINHLRLEAMRLFEQCLTSGDDTALITFIEQQLVQDPPQLYLLHEIADDLQQRLLSLREHHFDVRERVVSTLSDSYQIDVTPLAPPHDLAHYHHLKLDQVMAYVLQQGEELAENDLLLLRKLVGVSLEMAAQLHADIEMTARLHLMVLEWLEGMSSTLIRQYWPTQTLSAMRANGNIQH